MIGLLQGANFHFPCLSDPEAVVKEVFPVRLPSSTRALGQESGVKSWQTRTIDFSAAANISGSSPNQQSLKMNLTQVDSLLASGPSSSGLALTPATSLPISSYSFTSSQVTNVFHTSS